MLSPTEVAAVITAIKGSIDIFDRIASPIKRVLLDRSDFDQIDARDKRWRFKVETNGNNIVVREDERTLQTISGEEMEKKLVGDDLKLIETYEAKMAEYFELWSAVYAQKGRSPDPLKNAQVNLQLKGLIKDMRGELIGILDFLEKLGVQLDDHYMHVRQLVEKEVN